ncbi:MAG: hypothetical protein ABEI07_00755, partial [Candidatus Nanohaloarchaea archaeon]
EKHVTPDQVLGTALFTIPKIGYVKLVPTCIFLEASRGNVPRSICP